MNNSEINLPDYIDFLYDRFFMARVEYLIFTQNEQETKVLRVIEYCIELERAQLYKDAKARTPQGQKVEIPEIVWTPISHRFVMDQLFGTIQSETTVKEIFASLEKKHFIFRGPGAGGPYDAPIYTINKHLMAELTKLLPSSIEDLNMAAIMKQPRKVKKVREGQKLTPSIIDPLVEKIRETINAPLDPQLLALYSPIIAPLSRSRGGQKLPPKRYKETTKEIKEESNSANDQQPATSSSAHAPDTTLSLSSMTNDDLLAELAKRGLTLSTGDKEQATDVLPIASISTQSDDVQPTEQEMDNGSSHSEPSVTSATEKPAGKQSNKQKAAKLPPPVMPTGDAEWCAEAILEIHEAHQGRRYPNGAKKASARVRDVELTASQTLYDMDDLWTDDAAYNIDLLLKIIVQQETRDNKWWYNNNGYIMPHQLVDKDRVHKMYDELKRYGKIKPRSQNGQIIVLANHQQSHPTQQAVGYTSVSPIVRSSAPSQKDLEAPVW